MKVKVPLPILKGPLAGGKWLSGAGGKILRLMLGTYEPEQTNLFIKSMKKGAVFFDVGAHAGYYTLLSSKLVGEQGRVFAFEPNPRNYASLENHIKVNRVTNAKLVNKAVADNNGFAMFEGGGGSGTGHLSEQGSFRVELVTLDSFCTNSGLIPNFIKIDVEGAEMLVFHGARSIISSHHPTIFLSTHGKEIHNECCRHLKSLGYDLLPIVGSNIDETSEIFCQMR
jgi:FkbM family methyltransferase